MVDIVIFNTVSAHFYYLFLIICCGYAIYRGSENEYIGAAIMTVGSLATLASARLFGSTFTGLELDILVIDLIALYAFIHLAMVSDRFWPLWAAAFHLLAIAVHTAAIVGPDVTPWAFAVSITFWAYPMLLALAIGSHEHVRPAPALKDHSP